MCWINECLETDANLILLIKGFRDNMSRCEDRGRVFQIFLLLQ